MVIFSEFFSTSYFALEEMSLRIANVHFYFLRAVKVFYYANIRIDTFAITKKNRFTREWKVISLFFTKKLFLYLKNQKPFLIKDF